jgi:hypothetical protein
MKSLQIGQQFQFEQQVFEVVASFEDWFCVVELGTKNGRWIKAFPPSSVSKREQLSSTIQRRRNQKGSYAHPKEVLGWSVEERKLHRKTLYPVGTWASLVAQKPAPSLSLQQALVKQDDLPTELFGFWRGEIAASLWEQADRLGRDALLELRRNPEQVTRILRNLDRSVRAFLPAEASLMDDLESVLRQLLKTVAQMKIRA